MKTLSLADKLAQVERSGRLWTPHRIARFDGHQLLVAKLDGAFVRHTHADHDEVFLVVTGRLAIDFDDAPPAEAGPGELVVVPAGTPHRPRTVDGPCQVLRIDPMDVAHTGEVRDARTVDDYPEL